VLTWAISVPAGIYRRPIRVRWRYVLTVINFVGVATPNFMLALI
jgi:ABC-type dipeptide/oligopeptide/nickel transport system permease component